MQYTSQKPVTPVLMEVLGQWFGQKLYYHYYDEIKGAIPKKVRLKYRFSDRFRKKVCIYSHFPNKTRGIGIKDYYPEVDQFITILRDPFERVVSGYFHKKSINFDKWKDKSRFQVDGLEDYLKTIGNNSLNHFPFEITIYNYKDLLSRYFIHLGIAEDMDTSAKKLGLKAPDNIAYLNVSERTQEVPYRLKQAFVDNHQLEYAVYNFAKDNYNI